MRTRENINKIGTIVIACLFFFFSVGNAENAWVICQPDSFVYLRSRASFGSEHVAFVEAGDKVETNGRRHGNWVYVEFPCEEGGGWIFDGYLTDSEPEIYRDGLPAETDCGKVRARRYVKGPIRRTMQKGAYVIVYAVSDEWSVTDAGFIMTKYLMFHGEGDG